MLWCALTQSRVHPTGSLQFYSKISPSFLPPFNAILTINLNNLYAYCLFPLVGGLSWSYRICKHDSNHAWLHHQQSLYGFLVFMLVSNSAPMLMLNGKWMSCTDRMLVYWISYVYLLWRHSSAIIFKCLFSQSQFRVMLVSHLYFFLFVQI